MTSTLPQLVVEAAFATDPDVTLPAYQDISPYVLSLNITRGRQRELDTVQASTCTLRLDNGDRRFDPTYTHSPYYPYVLPMRKLRVSAVWTTVTYYLFTGYVERWPIVWDAPKWGSATVTAVDGLAALAQATISGTFPDELTGARIARVLSAASWPESTPQTGAYWTLGTSALNTTTTLSYGIPTTVLDPGLETVAGVTIADGDNVSALAHIQDVAGAERGVFFIDGQGRAVFQGRRARYNATNLVTFTDGSLSSTRLPYQTLEPDFAADRIVNEVIVTRPGGTAQTWTDTDSRQTYLRRTLTLSPPLTTDAAALSRAQFEVALRRRPHLEFTKLSVRPQGNTGSWPYALGLDLGNRVTVERTPDSSAGIAPETITQGCFVEGIDHTADPSGWTTSWQLSPAAGFDTFFELGAAALGSEASAVLAY